MVELLTGVAHDDLETLATVPNCMRVRQRLVTYGIRWMPPVVALLGKVGLAGN